MQVRANVALGHGSRGGSELGLEERAEVGNGGVEERPTPSLSLPLPALSCASRREEERMDRLGGRGEEEAGGGLLTFEPSEEKRPGGRGRARLPVQDGQAVVEVLEVGPVAGRRAGG